MLSLESCTVKMLLCINGWMRSLANSILMITAWSATCPGHMKATPSSRYITGAILNNEPLESPNNPEAYELLCIIM